MAGKSKIARGSLNSLMDFMKGFDKKVYHGQRDPETSTGIIKLKGDREFFVEDATGEYGGINAFESSLDKIPGMHPSDLGTWVTESKDAANYFAGKDGAVYPLKLKMKTPKKYNTYEEMEEDFNKFDGSDAFVKNLKEQGYDGIEISDSFTDIPQSRADYVVFDRNQLRSVHAKFDPKKSESGDILASALPAAITTGALSQLVDEEEIEF